MQRHFLSRQGFTPPLPRDRNSLHTARAGFTLSELLLAAGIMAFVLVGLLQLFISCIFINEANRNLSIASVHGQYVLEEMKNTNFTSFKNGSVDANTNWDLNSTAINLKGLGALNTEQITTDASWIDILTKDRLDISVTVSWKDFGVRNRSLVFRTMITEP